MILWYTHSCIVRAYSVAVEQNIHMDRDAIQPVDAQISSRASRRPSTHAKSIQTSPRTFPDSSSTRYGGSALRASWTCAMAIELTMRVDVAIHIARILRFVTVCHFESDAHTRAGCDKQLGPSTESANRLVGMRFGQLTDLMASQVHTFRWPRLHRGRSPPC